MTAAVPLAQWTVSDVCTNLRTCAWCSDELLVLFASNKVDGPCLLDLTLEDLQNDFFINIKSEAEEILARLADLAGRPLPAADGGGDGNAAAANAAAKAAAAAAEEDAQRQREEEEEENGCAGEGGSSGSGSSACAEQETIQALEDNLRSILRRTSGYADVDGEGDVADADASLLRESLASPSPQPLPAAADVAAAGASRSSSPAGSNASSTAEEDLSVPPHYHAEDTMPWVTFVDLQLRRAERCCDGDTLRWLGASDGGLLDLSRVRMYDSDGCSADVRRERRRRYKLCAKRAERMRMFGVLDSGDAAAASAAVAAHQPSTPTQLASPGLLEGFRREALLCELFDSWARARTVDASGPAEAAVPFGGLMLSLRVFFYWGDAVSDPEDRALQVVVDRRGCVGRAGFVSYVARLTALLPGAEFEQMEAFVRRCVVAPLQAAQRARRRDHILFELYKACEAAGGGGGGGGSRGLRGETLRGVLSGYNELLLDGERALAMDASAAGERFFADEVRGAAFVEGFRRLTDGFADDQLEQVLFKLGRSFEREREREAERVRCRMLQDGDFLRSDAAAAAAASDVVVVGEAEVRAAYLLSTRKTPVVFVGPLADPASALESFAFERHAHLRYCCVQTEAAAVESLGRLRRAVAKGVWFYAAVSAALPSFDGYLREVALLLEGCAEVLVHKRFRMFLHVPDAALPEVLMRRAVSIRADVYDTYNKRYVIRAGVSEGERTWR